MEETLRISTTVINYNNRQLQDVSCLDNKDEKSCECILEVHLSFNYISEVPSEWLSLYTRLTHLSLACNKITSLPPLCKSCPQLEQLCVANNQLSCMENLEGLIRLKCLDLRCNRIRCLDNLLTLTNLQELCVSGNIIDSVCWIHIPLLPSLHFMGLYGNKLGDLEDIIQQLRERTPELRHLNIGCNPFSNNRELSLHNTLLTMSHVDTMRVRTLYKELGRVFSSENCSKLNGPELLCVVESACKAYTQGHDYRRLMEVVKILLKLKTNFPRLEIIDENTLPYIVYPLAHAQNNHV